MTPLGLVIMVVSIGSIVSFTVFCLYRVLTLPPVEVSHLDVAPLDIRTSDADKR